MSETMPIEGETPAADPVQESIPGTETIAVEGEVPVETPPPDYDYLEVEDPSSKYVKVKVDGEEQSVPLAEAINGYQRQADYTSKTQELAAQRQQAEEALQVYQAMQANPGLTVQILADRAGVPVEQYLGMTPAQQQAATAQNEAPQFEDPLERELYETRQQVEHMQRQMQDQAADQRLRGVVNGLKEQYQISDAEAREAVRVTANMRLGIDAVPLVYRAMAYDKMSTEQRAAADAAATQQSAEQQRQAAAAAAQQSVAPSQISANGVTEAAPSHKPQSTREAIEMAFDEADARARR